MAIETDVMLLSPSEGDVVVLKLPAGVSHYDAVEAINVARTALPIGVLVLAVQEPLDISLMDEESMRSFGWVRPEGWVPPSKNPRLH